METVITIEELETTLPLSNFQESINNALRKPASATVPSETSQSPTKQGRRRRPTHCVGERNKDDLPGKQRDQHVQEMPIYFEEPLEILAPIVERLFPCVS